MAIWEIIAVLGVGIVSGIINTVAGGGALLALPLLIFLGLPSPMANGTYRLAVLAQSAVAAAEFRRRSHLPLRQALWLTLPAMAGAWLGAGVAVDLPERTFNRILAVVLVLAVGASLRPTPRATSRSPSRLAPWLSFPVFFAIGWYGGFLQAGVGFALIAGLVWVCGADLVRANALKAVIVLGYTMVAFSRFVMADQVHWPLALTLAAGNVGGAWLGVHLAVTRGHGAIRWFIAGTALLFAVVLWMRTH